MSYIYHGKKGWIKQPNRNFKTWESGLCLIQEEYICAANGVDYSAFQIGNPIDDSAPCIDGAYIFPEPVYENLGNGFVKATVSAYGRTNADGYRTTVSSFLDVPAYAYIASFNCTRKKDGCFGILDASQFISPIGTVNISVPCPIIRVVLPENQFPILSLYQANVPIYDIQGKNVTNRIYYPFDFQYANLTSGQLESRFVPSVYHGDFSGKKINIELSASGINSTNYGKFTEFVIQLNKFDLYSSSIFFGIFYKKAAPYFYNISQNDESGLFFDVTTTYPSVPFGISNQTKIFIDTVTANQIGVGEAIAPLNNAEKIEVIVRDLSQNVVESIIQEGTNATLILDNLDNGAYVISAKAINQYGETRYNQSFSILNPP